ncbi:hypothetical protein BDV12DRAFT_5262 [Aspergillus spectabilis]
MRSLILRGPSWRTPLVPIALVLVSVSSRLPHGKLPSWRSLCRSLNPCTCTEYVFGVYQSEQTLFVSCCAISSLLIRASPSKPEPLTLDTEDLLCEVEYVLRTAGQLSLMPISWHHSVTYALHGLINLPTHPRNYGVGTDGHYLVWVFEAASVLHLDCQTLPIQGLNPLSLLWLQRQCSLPHLHSSAGMKISCLLLYLSGGKCLMRQFPAEYRRM